MTLEQLNQLNFCWNICVRLAKFGCFAIFIILYYQIFELVRLSIWEPLKMYKVPLAKEYGRMILLVSYYIIWIVFLLTW